MTSAFGARFDMEVDALLIQVLAVLAWQWDKAGPWVLMSGLLRYVFVAAGWVLAVDAAAVDADACARKRSASCRS